MSKRVELRQMYGRGRDAWDANLLKASLAEDFSFDDPALPDRMTVNTIADYMSDWPERVKALGALVKSPAKTA